MSCCCTSRNCEEGKCPFKTQYEDCDYEEDIQVLRDILQDARDEIDELKAELEEVKNDNNYLESVVASLENDLHNKG